MDPRNGPWHLVLDGFGPRLLASAALMPALVMAVNLEGAVEWMTLAGPECCNFPCLVPRSDRILHASSCGRTVTALSDQGVILHQSRLPPEIWPFLFVPDGRDGGCILGADRFVRFDADARITWEIRHGLDPGTTASAEEISELLAEGWRGRDDAKGSG